MFKGCSRLSALRVRSLDCSKRLLATAPKSLLDLLVESTMTPKAEDDKVARYVKAASKRDYLHEVIIKAGSSEQLLEVIRQHGIMMNWDHLFECWRLFSATVEAGGDPESLKGDPRFDTLIDVTRSRLVSARPEVLFSFGHYQRRFQFSADSGIIETFCRVLGLRLVDIPLSALVNIESNLKQIEGTSPELDILRLSVPVVFQARVRTELDGSDFKAIYRAVMFVLRYKLDPKTIEFVANVALQSKRGFSSVETSFIVHNAAMATEMFTGSMRELISKSLDMLSQHKSELTEEHIEDLLRCCQKQQIASKVLLDNLWSLAPSWPSEKKAALLRTSFQQNQVTLTASEYALDLAVEKKEQVIEDLDLLGLAEAVALVNLHHKSDSEKQAQVDSAKSILLNAMAEISDMLEDKPHQLAETLLHLATLEIYPESLLAKLFNHETQKKLCDSPLICEYVFEIEQCLKTIPGLSRSYKTIANLEAVSRDGTQSSLSSSLRQTLQLALGGEKFVAEKVKTLSGTPVDYVIAMRGGEYAMAFADDPSETFKKIPPGSKVIAILLERNEGGDWNVAHTRKFLLSLKERSLRAQDLCTLVIDVNKFESMRPFERTPFVMKRIKEAAKEGPLYGADDLEGSTPSRPLNFKFW